MQQGEEAAAIGVGEGSSRALLLRNIRFQIGQVRFAPDAVFALSLDVISGVEGRKVDGVIGLDFFHDHVVEIDYRHRRLRLTDAGVQADLHHNAITLTFIDGLPIIDAIVTDNRNVAVRCQLEIDTGATRPLLLTSSFIASHSDFEFSSASLHVPLIGLGQVSTQRITRIGKLTIGPYAFEHPVTGISEAQSGLSARAGIDGMIGGELLARFRLVIDYAHQWIVFESENDIRRRFEYDMSGLILLAEGPDLKKYVVRYVLPNSPAADAALQVNDVISSVDGKSTSQLTISTIAVMFSKPGQTYHLVIKRGGNKIRTKLKPRPLV
jgi:hypothetical protein